jgi:hypothetical protein
MRIVRTRYKVLYVIVVFLIILLLQQVVFTRILPYPIEIFVGPILEGTAFYVGTRTFRGSEEPAHASRDWWRMTARPRASLVIGVLLCISAALDIIYAVTRPSEVPTFVVAFVEDAALAFFYFNSRARLERLANGVEPVALEKVPLQP